MVVCLFLHCLLLWNVKTLHLLQQDRVHIHTEYIHRYKHIIIIIFLVWNCAVYKVMSQVFFLFTKNKAR